MIRETSIETFRRITEAGLLPPARQACYEALYGLDVASTATEIGVVAGSAAGKCPWKRVGECVKQGVMREAGQRPCTKTNQTALVYVCTDNLPIDIPEDLEKVERPTVTELREAFLAIKGLVDDATRRGATIHPSLRKLALWVRYLVLRAQFAKPPEEAAPDPRVVV